jgi:hypothetical protein
VSILQTPIPVLPDDIVALFAPWCFGSLGIDFATVLKPLVDDVGFPAPGPATGGFEHFIIYLRRFLLVTETGKGVNNVVVPNRVIGLQAHRFPLMLA